MSTIPPSPAPVPQPSSNSFKAIVRSLMPFVYSGAAALIAHFGYHVSNAVTVQIVTIVGVVLTIVLHALESQFPWIGVFLGYLGAPVYAPSAKVTLAASQKAQIATLETQLATFATLLEQHGITPPPPA